jgi:ELWxxDGT repeat protein
LVEFTPVGDGLVFEACTGYINSDTPSYCELWRSDGSEAQTVRVSPFHPDRPRDEGGDYSDLVAANGWVFFQTWQPDASGDWYSGLWRSDGTPGGTTQVLDLPAGFGGDLTSVGDTLFFRGAGTIWKSDGTAAGTASLGVGGSRWTNVRGTLFFNRYHPVSGAYQLWRTDGTEVGTLPLTDFSIPESPRILGEVSGTLFLNIHDQEVGSELFGLALCSGEPGPCDPLTGECESPPWGCDDADACTTDGCDLGVGCIHTVTDECLPTTTSTSTSTLPDSTTTSSTTMSGSTTTTSTTVPISTTSTTLTCSSSLAAPCDDADPCTVDLCTAGRCYNELRPGLAGVRCRLRHHAPSLACEDSIPQRLERRLDRARTLVKRASDASDQRTSRRCIRRATRQLEAAEDLLVRDARHGMGSACTTALERAIAEVRAEMNDWLAKRGD